MKWIEANPLPMECRDCTEEDCYNCDIAGHRWSLPQEDELRIRSMILAKAGERLARQEAANGNAENSCCRARL